MRKKAVRIRPGDIIEFPISDKVYGYARVFEDGDLAPYRFIANSRPGDISLVISTGPAGYFDVAEYRSEKGEWPRIGTESFSSGETKCIPPFRIEKHDQPGRFRVVSNGSERPATPDDDHLPISRRYGEESFIAAVRELLKGVPIWPTGEPFDPDKHPAPKFVEEHSDDPNSFKTLDEVKVPLSLTSLNDDIVMPCVRAVRKVVNSLKKLGDDATNSEKLDIFQACVEKINQIEEKHGGIDTSDRETLLDLLYAIGDLVGLSRADEYLDEWREW